MPVLDDETELYIFSFERTEESGMVMPLMVRDRVYENVSDFADDYIRTRHLLIYSDLTFRNTSLTQMGEDCIISIDRKHIKFLRVLEALHQ